MGSGVWSVNTYSARASQRKASGQDVFEFSRGASAVHPTLNPHGLEVRESRDSQEHPDSNSIIVGLDVSGSMGAVVRGIHADLPNLLGLLLNRAYVPHPQIMFAAFSNASCDAVPLQVGQFESDNRMDVHLENIILGGQLAGGCDPERESAEMMIYLAARHTSIDCYEKRKRKGYLFLITDEMSYTTVSDEQVKRVFGRTLPGDIPLETIVREAQDKYHLFVVIPAQTQSGQNPAVHDHYRSYFDPQHVIVLNEAQNVSEIIALTIGLTEGTITLDQGMEHLREAATGKDQIEAIRHALSKIGSIKGSSTILNLDDKTSPDNRGTKRL